MKMLLVILLSFNAQLYGQSIYTHSGTIHLFSMEDRPVIGGYVDNWQEKFWTYGLELPIKKSKNIFSFIEYSSHNAGTLIRWDAPRYNLTGNGIGIGFTSTESLLIGINKYFFDEKKRISVIPGLALKLTKVDRTFPDYKVCQWYDDPYDTHYGCLKSKVYPGLKFMPVINIIVDIIFLYRWHFYLNYSASYGFMPYQDIEYFYTYEGVRKPSARYVTNGTSYFTSFGFKFDFVKVK